MAFSPCAIVPVYNQHERLDGIVAALLRQDLPVILVDDGSDEPTRRALLAMEVWPKVECLTQSLNRGKGAAVMEGFHRANVRGFSHALQVDADGQHDLADIPNLLGLAQAHPDHLISGAPCYDQSVPAVRFYGRYLTHALIWLDTLSLSLRDSMCGFRVYPVAASLALDQRVRIGRRMDFDTDIMTRLYWAGTECLFMPTHVNYPADGTSNFRMFRDNARMVWLHLRLFAGMWPRMPALLRRNLNRKRTAHWARIAERGSIAGIRFVGLVDRTLGRTVCCILLTPVIVYFMTVHSGARRASRKFLLAVGLKPSLGNRFRQLMNFSVSMLDKVRAWHRPTDIQVDATESQCIHDQLNAGQGLLLLTAHVGNSEALRAVTTLTDQLASRRVNALVYSGNSLFFNAMLKQANVNYPIDLIQVSEIGVDTAMALRERIAAGEVIVMAGDRVPVSDAGPTVLVDFLGQPAPFAIGPYVLAHLLECPVYLFFGIKDSHGYKVYAERFAERIQLPRARRQAMAETWAARYAERLAEYARSFPLQWYNFYDLWADDESMSHRVEEPEHVQRPV